MANSLYDNARERLLTSQLNWPTLNLVMLAYTGNPATSFNPAHLNQGNIGTPYAVSSRITNPVVLPGGYAASDSASFLSIPIGTNVTFFVIAEDNATPTIRKLLVYLDQIQSLPLIPNGGNYLIKPDWSQHRGWFRA